ncbi:MAG: ankyrin repeat domain-containing protein [Verrucomicrobia bacterium]|nr:ankyrin repeat domain-containing protein [Verrucomicrobiota bacterium]MBV8486024.1 ankyrin repeat domain-containing protein [Verrucomicrobiota bacterium]
MTFLLLLPLFGCSKSKEDLVKELNALNFQFNGDDFVRSAAEGDQKALGLFFAAGFDVNTPNSAGYTGLMAAAERGRADIVKLLLDHKADPNVAGRDAGTALMLAAENNQPEIVKLLLGRGADPNRQDNNGWTALLKAAYQGHAKCIEILASHTKQELDRALLVATLMERKDAVKVLLDNGAEVDFRASDGRTPLILAAGKGNKDIVELLLKAGADASLTDQGGQTAEAVAAAKGFSDIADSLRHAPAPSGTPVAVTSPSASGETASATGSATPPTISDDDILKMPNPSGSAPSASPGQTKVANVAAGAPSVTGKIRVEDVEEAFLPVTLDEVHGKKATLREADGSIYTVTVGDVLKGMSYRVVDVEARSVNDKDGNVVDASVVKLRHERTGQTISLIKGIPTREHGAYAVLVVNSTGQKIKVELDHEFSLPDEPGQTYRILDIRPTQVVIKRMKDGEVWTLQKSAG